MPRYGRRRGRSTTTNAGTPRRGTLVLSASTVTLRQVAGSTDVVQAVVGVGNSGAGTFSGVQKGAISYGSGSGWLSVTVQAGFPAIITAVGDASGLAAGTYSATVPIADANATNSPQTLTVSFVVTAAPVAPTIVRSPTTLALSAQQGNATTSSADVLITSGTSGVLAGPTVGTITGTGSTGVTAAVTGIGPSYTLTVTGASAALTSAGSPYTATVPIVDADASNSPQDVTVTLTVTAVAPPPTPTMLLSSSTLALSAVEGSGVTRSGTITVTSGNGAALGTTAVGTITGTGAAALSTSVTGHVVTISAAVGSWAAGVYTLTVPITDSAASNSPQNVTVTFTVTASNVPTTTIPSAIHLLGSTAGTVLVVGGFPLRPGDLTSQDVTDRKFAVFVNGVEQALYVQAFPGYHPDGTSLRAVGYQFSYVIPNSTPITAEVRLGTARTTTDRTKLSVTHDMCFVTQPPQAWGVDAEPTAKLLPTDLDYLCATDAAFTPLQPASADDPASAARFTTFLNTQYARIKNLTDQSRSTGAPIGAIYYQSTYESGRALIAQWCRTGNTDMVREALKQGYRLLEYTGASTGASRPSPTNNIYADSDYRSADGSFAESSTMRFVSYAACWQLSWFVPFFAGVNSIHMHENSATRAVLKTASTPGADTILNGVGYIEQHYAMRANVRKWVPHIMAYAIGANRRQLTASGYGNRDMVFPTELPHIIAAIANTAYTKGDYRDGFVGTYQNATIGGTVPAGQFPNFQTEMVNAALWLYEHVVYADSRIPDFIKTNTSVILQNAEPLTAASRGYGYTTYGYGIPYDCTGTAAQGTPQSDYLGLMVGSIAYCAARWPNDVVNGATFTTWYQRAVDPKNNGDTPGPQSFDWGQFARAWKVFGEMFGFQMSAPYWLANGVPSGPATIHAQSVITSWPT